MTQKRTPIGLEVEETLGEVLAHVRGEIDLPCRIAGDRGPFAESRPNFSATLGRC